VFPVEITGVAITTGMLAVVRKGRLVFLLMLETQDQLEILGKAGTPALTPTVVLHPGNLWALVLQVLVE
jgi:hypothetical protein